MHVLSYLLFFILSYSLTALLRNWAIKTHRLDQPNARSSHQIPTPRGGGLAFVICFIISMGSAFFAGQISAHLSLAFLIAGGGIALLGGLDDRYSLPASVRFLVQLLLSFVAVWGLGISQPIYLILGVLYLTWLTNLFNFMDGINGLATMEAIFVALGMLLFADGQLNFILGSLIAALMGFGLWNFPRARIFMGDVGSGFLGMVLGITSLVFVQKQTSFFAGSLILMGIFISDATFTLLKRAVRRERIWEAHCEHAYQRLAKKIGSHVPVTLGALLVNLLWLLPLALLTALGQCPLWLSFILAYLPLSLGISFFAPNF